MIVLKIKAINIKNVKSGIHGKISGERTRAPFSVFAGNYFISDRMRT